MSKPTVIVEVKSQPDNFGRQHFALGWPAVDTPTARTDENGYRWQCFFGPIADRVAKWEARGFAIETREVNA